jgi:shikimate dehydrogenase
VKRLAVLGHPVGHSRSPAMQNAALAELGLDDWSYEAVDVAPDEFEDKVREMAAGEWVGANVTVPHKGAALAVADELSEVAREVGAANTLHFEDGRIRAYNTDAKGLTTLLPEPVDGSRALVLGAGGAARAVVWALVRRGAAVDVWNRTELRSANLCEDLGGTPVADPDQGGYDLIANTTAVGLRGEDPFEELPLSADGFRPVQLVVDLVYSDRPTALLEAARQSGAETIDGLAVLVAQGAVSLKIWTDREPPLEAMERAARSGGEGPR